MKFSLSETLQVLSTDKYLQVCGKNITGPNTDPWGISRLVSK